MANPIRSASVSLLSPFADGAGSQSVTVQLADFDAEHHSTVNPPWVMKTNNQPTLLTGSIDSTGLVKIKTIAPKPGNINSAVLTFSDGLTRTDGPTPVFTVNVTISARPDDAGPELAANGIGTPVDEPPLIG